jgi:cardiolipin synthase
LTYDQLQWRRDPTPIQRSLRQHNVTFDQLTWLVLFVLDVVIVFGFILVERRRTPVATLAWVMAVIFVPVAGIVGYLVFGRTRMARSSRRLEKIHAQVNKVITNYDLPRTVREHRVPRPPDSRTPHLLTLSDRISTTPASDHNACVLLVDADDAYDSMEAAILTAKDHIHMEFYIFRDDDSGRRFRDLLTERANADVEVRVVVDAVGSVSLDAEFFDPLLVAGGQFQFFSPVNRLFRLRRPNRIDFRNHRKILVVDGHVGFTGGINIGDEYRGLDEDLGNWRDTHMRIEGPAVLGLQQAFAEDWLWTAQELLSDRRYYPSAAPEAGDVRGTTTVAIVDSGPDRNWMAIHRIHVQAIAMAHQRVWITNPYFVPDRVMEESIVTAALRGVDVRLLVPESGDNALITMASEAHFLPLLEAGVRIFRYRGGFVHAKTLVVDRWVGTVGSANMDIRSFQLNFELNAFAFGESFCDELGGQFEQDCLESVEITLEAEQATGYGRRLLRSMARLLSPLL